MNNCSFTGLSNINLDTLVKLEFVSGNEKMIELKIAEYNASGVSQTAPRRVLMHKNAIVVVEIDERVRVLRALTTRKKTTPYCTTKEFMKSR